MQNESSHHHCEDEEVRDKEEACHDASDDLDGIRSEGLRDCECRGDESRVREAERIPSHCELELSMPNTGPMRKDRYEEEPNSEARKSARNQLKREMLTPITTVTSNQLQP